MRTNLKNRLGVLGVLAASVALGGLASPASASDGGRRGAVRNGHTQPDRFYAGTLRIGDHRFVFRSDTFVRDEIAYRFRQLGLDAWGSGDKVYVRFRGRHRPSIGWQSGTHQIKTWTEGDCLVIRILPPARSHYEPAHHGRPVWREGRGRRHGSRGSWIRRGRPYTRASIGITW